ncbi:TrgA family protein [Jannaschia sp. Os4]|uniref:TrgA family protein n=1 Tax=Jannaschia sp. Os4 TaxID=2807617 RepID=UPI001939D774|nr:TrgA family protein [Jannaschia sp. Os4]MBM2577975.1 TrgA family protein [Jannaschia sp. Os4]
MPTPARLAAAILLAALAWGAIQVLTWAVLYENAKTGGITLLAVVGGALVGWFMLGKTASGEIGKGERFGVCATAGIGAAVTVTALCLVLNSFWTMILKSLKSVYTEPYMAMEAWMAFLVEDLAYVSNQPMLATIFGGGLVVGMTTWAVGRIWH